MIRGDEPLDTALANPAHTRAEVASTRTARRLAAQLAIVHALAAAESLGEVLPKVMAAVSAAHDWKVCLFWRVDTEYGRLRCEASWSTDPVAFEPFVAVSRSTILAKDAELPGRAWAEGQAQWLPDIDGLGERHKRARAAGLQSALAFPVRFDDGVFGVFEFLDRRMASPDTELLETLFAMGVQLAHFVKGHRAQAANRRKDEFLATISHELRTPLNAILGWATLLRGKGTDTATLQQGLETIERNARAQAHLIEDILDVSRITTGKMRVSLKPVDAFAVVTAALDVVGPMAKSKGVELAAVYELETGSVLADADRLQQVVWNLLCNAVKFTPAGGRVTASVGRGGSGQLFIEVTDTGQGIAPDFLPHVFERFQQGDPSITRMQGGLGLGLAIVRHLVELHGGTIDAQSAGVGLGASFRVSLPLCTLNVNRRPSDPELPHVMPELFGRRVLVVDDHEDARLLVASLVRSCEAEVLTAGSASEALALFRRTSVDVVVSDVGMPEGSGYDLIRQIRRLPKERGGGVRALALTAYARKEDRIRALEAGFDMHATKPIEPRDLVKRLVKLVSTATPTDDEFSCEETVRFTMTPSGAEPARIPASVRASVEVVGTLPYRILYRLTKVKTFVGRGDVDIRIRDSTSSRRHAILTFGKDGFRVTDAESANGVRLNGKRVKTGLLRDGDVLRIGSTELRFYVQRDDAAAPATR